MMRRDKNNNYIYCLIGAGWDVLYENKNDIFIKSPSGKFELHYMIDLDKVYCTIDDDHYCNIGVSLIESIDELGILTKIYENSDCIQKLNSNKVIQELIKLGWREASEDDFELDPVKPYRYVSPDNKNIIILTDDVGDIEFMYKDIRTELDIFNKEQLEILYNYYNSI